MFVFFGSHKAFLKGREPGENEPCTGKAQKKVASSETRHCRQLDAEFLAYKAFLLFLSHYFFHGNEKYLKYVNFRL